AVTRVLAQRHAAARVAGTEHAAQLDRLKDLRRSIDNLLRDTKLPRDDRDRLLTKATDECDALERELAKIIPMRERAKVLDQLGPDALPPLLPKDAVLIDFVRYTKFDYDPAQPGKTGEARTPSYAAFVVGPTSRAGQVRLGSPDLQKSIVRIELGEAK